MTLYNGVARHQGHAIGRANFVLGGADMIKNAAVDSNGNVNKFERRTYKVEEVAKMLGIGRSSAYSLVRGGHFKTVRIGASIRISKASFDEWLGCENANH